MASGDNPLTSQTKLTVHAMLSSFQRAWLGRGGRAGVEGLHVGGKKGRERSPHA